MPMTCPALFYRENRFRGSEVLGSGLFLASFYPCLEIYEPSAGPHSSLQTMEQVMEWTHIAKKILCQVTIGSLTLLSPSTRNLKPETCERLLRFIIGEQTGRFKGVCVYGGTKSDSLSCHHLLWRATQNYDDNFVAMPYKI